MAENSLVAKINADTERQVTAIKAEADAVVTKVKAEIDAKLTEMRAAHEAALQKERDHLELVAISKAKQAGKIAVQKAKRDHLDAVFTAAREQLVAKPAEAYVAYFGKLVEESVPAGASVSCVRAPEVRKEETTSILTKAGLVATVIPDTSIAAGLIVETADGVYDLTLDRLLGEARASLEMEVLNEVMQ